MNFEPQKFFISLMEFFSILMPGGFLSYLGKDWAAPVLLGRPSFQLEGAEAWMVFLFASYLLGHFVFLLGAQLDRLYDFMRKWTPRGQIERLARGKTLSRQWQRSLATSDWLFGRKADAAVIS